MLHTTRNRSTPPFDRIAATLAALVIVGLMAFLLVRNEPIADSRLFFGLRLLLSFGTASLGASIPGFLYVGWSGGGLVVRAGGALALFVLTFVYTPDLVTAQLYSGVLTPRATLLFSPDGGKITKIQIGNSKVFIVNPDDPQAAQLFSVLRTTEFRVENIGVEVKVSAQMFDREGHLITELVRNEWKVAPPPRTWDRNYTDHDLEVRDTRGLVILQVRALKDRVQLQGLWWIDLGPPNGIRQLTVRENPEGSAEFNISPADTVPPPIVPIFEYPSERHLGELRKAE